ncbi:hypothetical protein DEJ47_17110 [Streptomyces venezuelae]|uniref:Uncharacterized protein n=1 Tax=Streptomyces venezuelae TaxID=54571 RepID=A0A5P2BDX4_STRVZ|nr:hypothetical protein DEJ47_17110 [Streptomyces venezuelae]
MAEGSDLFVVGVEGHVVEGHVAGAFMAGAVRRGVGTASEPSVREILHGGSSMRRSYRPR